MEGLFVILLYELPDNEQGNLVMNFLDRIGKGYRRIDRRHGGVTLGALLAGAEEEQAAPGTPTDSAIFFDRDIAEVDARQVLEILAQVGIQFRFQVLVQDDLLERPIGDILADQAEHMAFLKSLRYLQDLVDRAGKLKRDDYDPDRYSEMKFAVAAANELMDDFVAAGEGADQSTFQDRIARVTGELQETMERLLTYKPEA